VSHTKNKSHSKKEKIDVVDPGDDSDCNVAARHGDGVHNGRTAACPARRRGRRRSISSAQWPKSGVNLIPAHLIAINRTEGRNANPTSPLIDKANDVKQDLTELGSLAVNTARETAGQLMNTTSRRNHSGTAGCQ
jgi:hypothetical protein